MVDSNQDMGINTLYEVVFLCRCDISTRQVETLLDGWKKIIQEASGEIAKTEYWGVRDLPYRIKKNDRAHFSLMNIAASSALAADLARRMQLATDVIRHLIIRVEKHEEGESIILKDKDKNKAYQNRSRSPRDNKYDNSSKDTKPSQNDRSEKPIETVQVAPDTHDSKGQQ